MKISEATEQFIIPLAHLRRSKSTITFYLNCFRRLEQFFNNCQIDTLTADDLRRFQESLFKLQVDRRRQSGRMIALSASTITGNVKAVRLLFRWSLANGLIASNPANGLKLPRLQKRAVPGISDHDRRAMIEAAYKSDPRNYAMLLFAGDTGCSFSSLANLLICDVDPSKRQAVLNGRHVNYSQETAKALQIWLEIRDEMYAKATVNNVFISYGPKGQTGDPLKPGGVYNVFRRIAHEAGVTAAWHPRRWKHFSETDLQETGHAIP